MATAESFTGISHQQVSRWAKSLNDRDAYRAKLYGRAYSAAMAVAANQGARELLSQSDQNDWRTPGKYLDAARDGGKP